MKKMMLISIMALLVATPCFAQLETTRVDGTLWGELELWDAQVITIGFFDEAVYICPLGMECEEAEILFFNDRLTSSFFVVSYNEGFVGGLLFNFFLVRFGTGGSLCPGCELNAIETSPIRLMENDWTP
jgi:hypothetical protein